MWPVRSHTGCVSLSKFLTISGPQLCPLETVDQGTYFTGLLGGVCGLVVLIVVVLVVIVLVVLVVVPGAW